MIRFKVLLLILTTAFVLAKDGNTHIEGKWTMCVQGTDDNRIVSNVCTNVIFSGDGTGVVKMGDEIRSTFLWKIDSKTINFSFKSEEERENFFTTSSSLKYKTYQENEFEYFKLIEQDHGYWYLLSRSNK